MIDYAREVQGERSVQARLANAEPPPLLAVQSSLIALQRYNNNLYLKNIFSIILVKWC